MQRFLGWQVGQIHLALASRYNALYFSATWDTLVYHPALADNDPRPRGAAWTAGGAQDTFRSTINGIVD
ncbi:hypothetical protein NCCP2165_19090 [Halomonas sp. NCCP-2165]|nr:hypothetical protein NCCP2165_19090 [Halomonas sp. NCCP-2165]